MSCKVVGSSHSKLKRFFFFLRGCNQKIMLSEFAPWLKLQKVSDGIHYLLARLRWWGALPNTQNTGWRAFRTHLLSHLPWLLLWAFQGTSALTSFFSEEMRSWTDLLYFTIELKVFTFIKCFEHEMYQARKNTASPTVFVKSENAGFCDFTLMFMGELLLGGIASPISKQQCFQ